MREEVEKTAQQTYRLRDEDAAIRKACNGLAGHFTQTVRLPIKRLD